jgi:hypothetical protein
MWVYSDVSGKLRARLLKSWEVMEQLRFMERANRSTRSARKKELDRERKRLYVLY